MTAFVLEDTTAFPFQFYQNPGGSFDSYPFPNKILLFFFPGAFLGGRFITSVMTEDIFYDYSGERYVS
jgi:hypothetical protein